jgi:ABC-type spermidine/putrescine transport system permease subunit II
LPGGPGRETFAWLWAAAMGAFLFLYVPLAIVVVYSFNDSTA